MLTIIKDRTHATVSEKRIEFDHVKYTGYGYSFGADKDGKPVFKNDTQKKNFEMALRSDSYAGPFARTLELNVTEPAEAICECGEHLFLESFNNALSCPRCGRWYNDFGDEILPPDKWPCEDYY